MHKLAFVQYVKSVHLACCKRGGEVRGLYRPGCWLHDRDSIPFRVGHVHTGCRGGGASNVSGFYRGLITRGETAGALI